MQNNLEKSVADVLSDIRKEVKLGIWESEEEAVSDYKLRRERRV